MKSKSKKNKIKESFLNGFDDGGSILFPLAKQIIASTIGQNLVNVQPIDGMDIETRKRITAEVKAENRERKIDSILEEKPFKEMKIEEHPDYKGGFSADMLYLDFKYGTASSV